MLTNRLYATIVLDNQVTSIERTLREFNALPFELDPTEQVNVGPKVIDYQKTFNIEQLPELPNVFSLDLTLSWEEKGRTIRLTRSAYLSNFKDQ